MKMFMKFVRILGCAACMAVLTLLMICSDQPLQADAAMADNVYTEPFNAPYYAPQEARVVTAATSYNTGWQQSGGKWFYMLTNRTYYADGWKFISGKWYYFDGNGYCVTGWVRTTPDVKWGWQAQVMYFDPQNAWMLTGYQKIDGVGRYFNDSGYLMNKKGPLGDKVTVNGQTYILDDAAVCSRATQSDGAALTDAKNSFETLALDDVISGNYEFQATVNENTTLETFGFQDVNVKDQYKNTHFCNLTDESLKGQIGAWYRNVGTYQGRTIDARCVITDYKLYDVYGNNWGMVGFSEDAIGIAQSTLVYSEMRIEFYDHETGEQIQIKGYATVADVDYAQACAITSPYDKIYVADDCELLYTQISGGYPLFADDIYTSKARGDGDTSGQVLVYYDSSYFSFRFYNDTAFWLNDQGKPMYSENGDGSHPHFTESDMAADPDLGQNSWQSYIASRFARVETPHPPAKTVSDSDETNVQKNTLSSIAEGFSYKVSQNVPLQSDSRFYYSSYQVKDVLEPCLDYVNARVEDDAGNDVTSLYAVEVSGQTVTFTCKDPSADAFYGKNYHYIIDVKIDPAADLSGYLQGDVYVIPNVATLIVKSDYEDESYDTNKVETVVSTVVKDCSLTITKQSSKDGSLLKDAEFTLYEWDGSQYVEYGKLTNNGDGTYSISGYSYTPVNGGRYKVVETKNPEGFQGTYEQEFRISKGGGDAQKFTYTGENEPQNPKANVVITKADKASGDALSGAEFSLYEWSVADNAYSSEPLQILEYREYYEVYRNTTPLERTDANGGWFKIVETKNPDGYTGTWSQEFQIAEANGGTQEFSYTAENTKLVNLTINKRIDAEDFYAPHGDATFLFEITGTDVNGVERSYSRAVTFTEDYVAENTAEDGTVTLSAVIRNIPSGNYEIKEKTVSRYKLENIVPETDNISVRVQQSQTEWKLLGASADLTQKDGEVTFVNQKNAWDEFSHNDVVINSFTIQR